MNGSWPRLLRIAHTGVIVLLPLLLLTGLGLYIPSWHTALIPWLHTLLLVHIGLAILFLLCLLTPFLSQLPQRRLRLGEWRTSVAFTIAIFLTGIAIIWVLPLPAGMSLLALPLHGLLSVVLALWTARHAFYAQTARSRLQGPLDAMPRRAFLTWALRGAGALVLSGLLLDFWYGLYRLFTRGDTAATAAASALPAPYQPGFQYYTVTDGYPLITKNSYELTVGGLVSQPMSLAFTDLQKKFPWTAQTELFQCVTGWSVPNCRWRGISLSEVLKAAQPSPKAQYVLFRSGDGVYTESLPIELVTMRRDIMLAAELNGLPLSQRGGAPLRLIVPGMNGYKSIKWLTEIHLSATDSPGYWEQRGYPEDAWAGLMG